MPWSVARVMPRSMSERTQLRTQIPRDKGPDLRARHMDRDHHRFCGVGPLPVPAARAYAALERAENRTRR